MVDGITSIRVAEAIRRDTGQDIPSAALIETLSQRLASTPTQLEVAIPASGNVRAHYTTYVDRYFCYLAPAQMNDLMDCRRTLQNLTSASWVSTNWRPLIEELCSTRGPANAENELEYVVVTGANRVQLLKLYAKDPKVWISVVVRRVFMDMLPHLF